MLFILDGSQLLVSVVLVLLMLFTLDGSQLLVSVVFVPCNTQQTTTSTVDSSKNPSDLTKVEAGLAALETKVP